MSAAHFHLLINHVPILGTIILAAIFAWGLTRRSEEVVLLGFWGVLVMTLVSFATVLTGEPAEEVVEQLPGFSHDLVEAHEGFAKLSMLPLVLCTVVAIASLVLRRKRGAIPRWAPALAVTLMIVGGAMMGWTGYLGGRIRHSELEQALEVSEHAD